MAFVKVDSRFTNEFIDEKQLEEIEQQISIHHNQLHHKTGAGSDFLGWLELPETYDRNEFTKIKACATLIQSNTDIFLVVGVGGSYLGARAAIELLTHSFSNYLPVNKRKAPQIFFVGHQLSSTYLNDLFDLLEGKDISINVISKSGTTTETAIAFRILKNYLEKKYGKEEATKRIYVTTDRSSGALKEIANIEQYETFIIPNDIGGRYSVLTAVGLLPIAVSGISIDDLIQGAQLAMQETAIPTLSKNHSYLYAALRNLFYKSGKKVELFVAYEPKFLYFQEWWKQLFGESEGKEGKGIFPSSAIYSTDLHSLGQYVQEGERHLLQTILHIDEPTNDIKIPQVEDDYDGLNYLTRYSMNDINKKVFEGALLAHTQGGVPNIILQIPRIDAFTFGYLVYFFQKACAMSGYLLNVNPFDQPGVEAYKQNLFQLIRNNY